MPSPDARPLVPLPLTDWQFATTSASFRQHGQQVTVTLDESAACLARLTGAIRDAVVQEKMQPTAGTVPDGEWLEGTPLWSHFNTLSNDQLAREVARLALLVASADMLGELTAAYLASARGVEVTFREVKE